MKVKKVLERESKNYGKRYYNKKEEKKMSKEVKRDREDNRRKRGESDIEKVKRKSEAAEKK